MNPFSRNSIDRRVAEGTAGFHLTKESQYGPQGGEGPSFLRYVVLDVVYDPAALDQAAIDRFEHELGVINVHLARGLPRNTVIGRRVMDGVAVASDPPIFLFPFLPPHTAMPCKPGEHVWVVFESAQKRHDVGHWMWRVSEPHFVDDVNHTHAPRALDPAFVPGAGSKFDGASSVPHEFRNGRPEDAGDGSRYTVAESAMLSGDDRAYERLIKDSPAAALVAHAAVPRYKKRPADIVLEGSNNALVVLGTDRAGPVADRSGAAPVLPPDDVAGAGMVDIVVGRGQTPKTGGTSVVNTLGFQELEKAPAAVVSGEGDPDFMADRARVYVAQATRLDKNFGLDGLNGAFAGVVDSSAGDGAVAVAADKVRIVARCDVEIVTTGFEADDTGLPRRVTDAGKHAVVVLKANGDIVLRPGSGGTIKLGGDGVDQHVVLGDELLTYLKAITTTFNNHMHPGDTVAAAPATAPGPPLPIVPSLPASPMDAPTQALVSDIALTQKSL